MIKKIDAIVYIGLSKIQRAYVYDQRIYIYV